MRLAALLTLSVLVSGCSVERSGYTWFEGSVGECSYTPSSTVTGVGPAIGSSDGGVAVTISTVPEHYVVTFYLDNGEKASVDDYSWWRRCRIGQRVSLGYRSWRFRGWEKWNAPTWNDPATLRYTLP